MWLSLIWFILVLFVCWNLFCTIVNPRIKCVRETKNVSGLFCKNIKSSFSTLLSDLTLRFLYILGYSGPRCGGSFLTYDEISTAAVLLAPVWMIYTLILQSFTLSFVNFLSKIWFFLQSSRTARKWNQFLSIYCSVRKLITSHSSLVIYLQM